MNDATTIEQLREFIATNSKVVVCFTAPSWCRPCQALAPHYHAAAEQVEDAVWIKVDLDYAEPNMANTYGVQSVPTLKLYKDGEFAQDVGSRTVVNLVKEVQDA